MRLKGCLWHEGSNGLGVGPMWLRRWLPCRKAFDAAARKHDTNYDLQGTGKDRFMYDKMLLRDMALDSETDIQVLFSIVYYLAVRCFGWLFYRYYR